MRPSPGRPLWAVLLVCCVDHVLGLATTGRTTSVVGVSGRRVDLPCDISTDNPADQAVLVIWYKNDQGKPIYSFDSRGDRSFAGRSRVDSDASRATFVASAQPASLRLAAVRPEDEAVYRCRVDFTFTPTRNQRVNLTVIIPPQRPVIVHEGRQVQGLIGPLQEGDSLTLTCLTRGGRPQPRVTWFSDERALDVAAGPTGSGQVTSVLRLPPLQRHHLHTRLRCSARNNDISDSLSRQVTVDMLFRPLGVEILGSARTSMLAGKSYDLVCRAYGSRPPANISWWIEGARLQSTQTHSDQENITSSTVSLVPRPDDHDRNITCRAENNLVSGGTIEDSRQLHVRYPPDVSVQLGYALDADDINEGADVYFDCVIMANPSVYSVVWLHNDAPLTPTARSSGVGDMVTINDRSLVIRNLTSRSAGAYRCRASNPEGEGTSRPTLLRVKYAPVCVAGQKWRYGTARNEAARVTCQVDANPDHVTFRWQFNSSVETLDLPFSQITTSRLRSEAVFTPKTDLDFGTLLCTADNAIGRMVRPCVFHIVPAGPPERLQNCSLINQTSESLQATCKAGFDGGLSQYFVAELFDMASGRLVRNLTRPFPEFSVTQLPAGLELRLQLYAANSRGRSRPERLDAFTLKVAEKSLSSSAAAEEPPEPEGLSITPVLGILIGVVASLIIIAIGVIACIRNGRPSRKPAGAADLVHASIATKDSDHSDIYVQAEPHKAGKLFDEDPNPDVVPDNKYVADQDYEVEAVGLLPHVNVGPRSSLLSPEGAPHARPPSGQRYQDDVIQYAELSLPRSGDISKPSRGRDPKVIYATIDHGRTPGAPRDTVVRTGPTAGQQESIV